MSFFLAPAPKVRRPQARGRLRRRELIEVAAARFSKWGSRGTGIAGVADEVGVSSATLLYHFGSKDGLLHAVLDQRDDAERPAWESALAQGGLDAVARLPSIVDGWERDPHGARLYTVLLAESLSPDAPFHDWFARRQSALRAGLADAIVRGQDRGEIRSDVDPRCTAIEIGAFMDGLAAEWSLDPERVPVRTVVEGFSARLIASLSGPGDGAPGARSVGAPPPMASRSR